MTEYPNYAESAFEDIVNSVDIFLDYDDLQTPILAFHLRPDARLAASTRTNVGLGA